MKYFVDIPENIYTILKKRSVEKDTLLYCAKADLDNDGEYINCYLFLDAKNLYIINLLQKHDNSDYNEDEYIFNKIPLTQIDDVEIVRDIYSAKLYLKQQENDNLLCRFSLGTCEMFEKFKDRLMKLKKSEEIDDKPLDQIKTFCEKCNSRYPDPNRPICPKCISKISILKRLFKMYGEYKVQAVIFGICVIATTVLGLITPIFSTKFLYDEVLVPQGAYYEEVTFAVLLILSTQIAALLVGMIYSVINAYFTPKMLHNLRMKLFSATQPLSLQFFTSKQTGNLMTRILDDTDFVYGFFIDVIPQLSINIIKVAGIIGVLLVLSPPMSIFVTLIISAFGFSVFTFFKKQRKIWGKLFAFRSYITSYVSDVLNGQRVVKSFSKENKEVERYNVHTQNLFTQGVATRIRVAKFMPKVTGIINILFAGVFLVGGLLIINGHLTIGSLVAFMAYMNMIFEPVDYLMWFIDWWASCINAASRMFEIMDAVPALSEIENPVKKEILKGDIELKEVSFEYEVGRPILKKVNMAIKNGEMFGIVGKTGAGKSTIINLISRLYDVNNGELIIDGVNIKNYSFETLRSNIGVVSQETYLFIGTLTQNIGYGVKDYTIDNIITAAKKAFAHDFISKLEDGYDSIVGSGGIGLSGGEKQRISIARAILQSPSILILDEATSAMDTQTERRIQHAIEKLRKGRTVIAIAHRLSTLRDADKLAVIEEGELKEYGTHKELINKKGVYFKLHKLQSDSLKFIEMGDDTMSGNVTSLYNLEDISDIKYLNKDNITFTVGEDGFLSAVLDGVEYEKLILNRLLPFSNAFGYISVQGKVKAADEKQDDDKKDEKKEEREIGIIKSIEDDLSKEQQDIIKTELEFRYYCPETSEILDIQEKMSFIFIKAMFGGVEKEICISEPMKNLRVSSMNKETIIATDVEGNKYNITNIHEIPKKCRQKMEMYVLF